MTRVFVSLVLSLPLVGAYAIFAIGIVLIYRASRMLNLAHGAMAMVPAYLLYTLVKWGVPVAIAFPVAIVAGAGLGVAVEKIFVSRLRSDGSTAQTVGTVAALGLLVAVVARLFGTAGLSGVGVFPGGRIAVGQSSIQYAEIGLFLVMLVVAAALWLLITRTDLGLMMRGTAESRMAASLMGVNPDLITSLTWAIGGALAALAGILLASVTSLHPYSLALQVLPAFIAALLGGLGSLPGAVLGAAVVGATQGLVPILGFVGRLEGAPQLFLAVLAIVVMATRGKSLVAGDDSGGGSMGDAKAKPPAGARSGDGRGRRRWVMPAIAAIVVFPHIPGMPSSVVGTANLAAGYSVIAVSLVLLTGWVGQISLGHAALVGIGGFGTGLIVEGIGIPFPFSLPLAAVLAGAAAALLGAVAVRVRGLYLAVATLVFSWMASEFLFRQPWFIKHAQIGERPIGVRGDIPFFDFADRSTFFLVAAAVVGAVVFGAANIRDSKTGRAFFALRGSEMAAASLGIDVTRYKLLAFVVSGAIAGAAGNLIMTESRVITADQFAFNTSLFYVAVAVVGGLISLGGAVASGLLFAGLYELFYRVPSLGAFLEIVSSALLALVLIAYRGGLASMPGRMAGLTARARRFTDPVVERVKSRLPTPPPGEATRRERFPRADDVVARLREAIAGARSRIREVLPWTARAAEPAGRPLDFRAALERVTPELAGNGNGNGSDGRHGEAGGDDEASPDLSLDWQLARARIADVRPTGDRSERALMIEASNITVRFGGLTAVDDASLEVREGEIVGLIGPNGAGKTTFFNAIAGYNNPAAGEIRLYGQDVTGMAVHERARVGVARTFQLIQLFRQLTVYENLLVATHVHNRTGFGSHVLVTSRSMEEEAVAIERVNEILQLLDLVDIAHARTGDLPFGVLRMVEVARALVTGFRIVMLDEPASGLDNAETDKLIEVLRFVRGLGVTLLLIEHDVRMVTGVSDYLYVLDQGRIIADGPPEEIQKNPDVIAAYLGEVVEEEPVGVS